MKRALLIVDVQHDFLPGGALAVSDGDQILPVIHDLVERNRYETIFASRDWHPPDHSSFSARPRYEDMSWPPHCVAGTEGAELHPEIAALKPLILDKAFLPFPDTYSAWRGRLNFSGGDLMSYLIEHRIQSIDVVGLATDYCVRATAIDASCCDWDTRVILDATRPVHPVTGMKAVAEMCSFGVRIE